MRLPYLLTACLIAFVGSPCLAANAPVPVVLSIDGKDRGRTFEGIGLVSSSGTSKLLRDYPEEQALDILDLLFKPFFGAGFTVLKNEIGADVNSSTGTEPCHRRTREERATARGVNFYLAKEALARNGATVLVAARWGLPAWADETAAARTEYLLDYVRLMGLNSTPLRQLSPGENEGAFDREGVLQSLRPALDANAYQEVALIAKDELQTWTLAEDLRKDKLLKSHLAALTSHYTTTSTKEAQACGLPLYNDEADVPMHDLYPRLMWTARNLIKQYVDGRMTRALLQPALDGVYGSVKYNTKGILTANTPWSGHYEVHKSLWMVAHFTQFAQPGWRFLDKACGHDGEDLWYQALRDPNGPSYSVIVLNQGSTEREMTIRVGGGLPAETLHVWRTNEQSTFDQDLDLEPTKDRYTLKVPPRTLLSITNSVGQEKGQSAAPIPSAAPLALPYRDDFKVGAVGDGPRYFLDQSGAFELSEADGERCLEQKVTVPPKEWQGGPSKRAPYSVFGDTAWCDDRVEVSVLLPEGAAAYVSTRGNLHDRDRNVPATGYQTVLSSDGAWALRKVVFGETTVLAQGTLKGFDPAVWHRIAVSAKGLKIAASVDDRPLAEIMDGDLPNGQGALGCSYHAVRFKDLSVLPEAGTPLWSVVEDRDPRIRFQGAWEDVDGEWKDTDRTVRRSRTRGNRMEVEFEGTAICLLGRRSGDCGAAEIAVDQEETLPVDTQGDKDLHRAALYCRDDLKPGRHKLYLMVKGPASDADKGGYIYVDAVLVQPTPTPVAKDEFGEDEATPTPTPEPKKSRPHPTLSRKQEREQAAPEKMNGTAKKK